MKVLSFLIKPASSSCNLRCKYCFYNDVSEHRKIKNSGIMNEVIMKKLIDEAFNYLDEKGIITFAFQGGEPTMAGVNYFKDFCSYVNQIKNKQQVNYVIQTNATMIDNEWCDFFKEYDFLVGVSLDGYKENHDTFRISQVHKATFKQVMGAIDLLRKRKIRFNVLTVLSKQLAKHPEKLYEFYQQEDIDFIQLIPCLAGFDDEENPFALTPGLFASFYKKFYDCWLKEFQRGTYRSIGLFDNIILMFANNPPQQCGMLGFCSLQLVVESDGNVYPCDFYVLDQYNGGNIMDKTLEEIVNSKEIQSFFKEKKKMGQCCSTCSFISICHGNCKRMNSLYFKENYCGYQDFLKYVANSMIQIAQRFNK